MSKQIVKIGIALWLTGVILAGFLLPAATNLPILEQTSRNLYFHVPMWIAMTAALVGAGWFSLKVLRTNDLMYDVKAEEAARVAMLFGVIGILTGMMWARFTWGKWWNFDPKQTMVAAQLLVMAAYFVLRGAFDHPQKRAKIAAAYNLFTLAIMPFTLFVIPRSMQSLHPGANGMPAFDKVTDPTMRFVLYPAFIGFIALAWWIYDIRSRQAILAFNLQNEE
jgi:heme exporter protein C